MSEQISKGFILGSCVIGGIVLGLLVLISWPDSTPAPVEAKTSGSMSPYAEAKARERMEAMDYWWDPAKHFEVGNLEVWAGSTPGLAKITGRAKNVGERDAEFLQLRFRLLDSQGRRVGMATAVNHDGLGSGEVWDFEAVLTAHASGGVQVQLDPNGVTAY